MEAATPTEAGKVVRLREDFPAGARLDVTPAAAVAARRLLHRDREPYKHGRPEDHRALPVTR